jgi:hypothetical protein
MEEHIIQGLALRAKSLTVLKELRRFLDPLREFPTSRLPREIVYQISLSSMGKQDYPHIGGQIVRNAGKFDIVLEREELSSAYAAMERQPYFLKKLITDLMVDFLSYDDISAEDIKLKKIISLAKKYQEDLINKEQLEWYAGEFVKKSALKLRDDLNKKLLRKILNFVSLNSALKLNTDLFYLQNSWYDLYISGELLNSKAKEIKRLFITLGNAIGFKIKK